MLRGPARAAFALPFGWAGGALEVPLYALGGSQAEGKGWAKARSEAEWPMPGTWGSSGAAPLERGSAELGKSQIGVVWRGASFLSTIRMSSQWLSRSLCADDLQGGLSFTLGSNACRIREHSPFYKQGY